VGHNFQKPVVLPRKNSGTLYRRGYWLIPSPVGAFHDPVLDSLVRTALRENRDVRIAAARIEEAYAAMKYNWAITSEAWI